MQPLRRAITVPGVLGAAAAAAGVAAHYLGVVNTAVARIAVFTPVLVVVGAVGVWSQVPLFTGAEAGGEGGGVTVRLVQANIRMGEADAAALVRTVTDERVDVLTLVELTEEGAQRLFAAGLTDVLPYHVARPRGGGSGAATTSTRPTTTGSTATCCVTRRWSTPRSSSAPACSRPSRPTSGTRHCWASTRFSPVVGRRCRCGVSTCRGRTTTA